MRGEPAEKPTGERAGRRADRARTMAALIVVTGALTGAFVGLPTAANAAAAGGTGDVGTTTFPGGPVLPPLGETSSGGGISFSVPPRGLPPQQGSSWTVPQEIPPAGAQPVLHATSTVGGVLSGTVDGVPDEGSSWT
jgi:hypothetical protein